jgi:hypothetical protein
MSLEFEVREDSQARGTWRVEAIDYDNEGVVYVAIFTGPRSHDRAEEYAAFKSRERSEGHFNIDKVYTGLRA